MEFSETERHQIAALRKRQERWRIFRWLFIMLGFAGVAAGLLVAREMGRHFAEFAASHQSLTVADLVLGSYMTYAALLSYLLGTCGVWMAFWGIIRWKGNPTITVLLALVDRFETAGAAGSQRGV